jgi:hypothetical protein
MVVARYIPLLLRVVFQIYSQFNLDEEKELQEPRVTSTHLDRFWPGLALAKIMVMLVIQVVEFTFLSK